MVALDVADKTVVSNNARPPRQRVLLPIIMSRVAIMIPTLLGIVTIAFILTHALGGNPARQIAGQAADPATIAKISHQYGFDRPLIVQYWKYLDGLVHGNLGVSTVTSNSVRSDLWSRFPSTLEMIILALALALAIGIPLGAYAGRTARRSSQNVIRVLTFVTLAIPDFWISLVALYLLFFKLGLLPSPTGQLALTATAPKHITGAALLDSLLNGDWSAFGDAFSHAILPIGVLGLLLSAPITRLMRSAMLATMESDFIRFGTSVGLGRARLWRYAVRNSVPTVITYVGTLFTILLGGTVLLESIFSWGGAAQYAADSIEQNDFSATQGFVLVCGVLSMVAFLLIDIMQLKLDPRIRSASSSKRFRSMLTWRSPAAAIVGASVVSGEPAAALSPADEIPAGEPVRPGRTMSDRFAPVIEIGQVFREIVLDLRPQRLPRAIVRMVRGGNAAMLTGGAIIAVMIAAAFIVPDFWKYKVDQPDVLNTLAAPSKSHPFGTDGSGFDIFIRVIYATRTDLWIATAGVLLSTVLGVALGLFIGFSRRRFIDDVVMRIVDMIQAFPVLIVAIALVAFAGNSLINVVYALVFINTPIFLRLARGQVLTVREHRYIEAASAMGNSRIRILIRHVFPNIVSQAIVQIGIQLGYALLTVASLAFLGVGVQAPTAEWGSMILTGKDNITTGQWWTVTFPGLAILLAVAGFNLLADGVERARDIYR
jgi:peptide/nickel transport system permease protein